MSSLSARCLKERGDVFRFLLISQVILCMLDVSRWQFYLQFTGNGWHKSYAFFIILPTKTLCNMDQSVIPAATLKISCDYQVFLGTRALAARTGAFAARRWLGMFRGLWQAPTGLGSVCWHSSINSTCSLLLVVHKVAGQLLGQSKVWHGTALRQRICT